MEKAYIAGLFDADGSIMIASSRRKWASPYRVSLALTNRDLRLLTDLKTIYGGSINSIKPAKPWHSACYHWFIGSKKAVNVLREIYPFLRIKRAQADLALELAAKIEKTIAYPGLTEEDLASRQKLWVEIKKLNLKGLNPEGPRAARLRQMGIMI